MAVNSPGTMSRTSFITSSSRHGSHADVSTAEDASEPYFQLCTPSPAATTPAHSPAAPITRSPSQSVRRKPRKKCKDLSHYNSVPPIGHISRSSSSCFSPSLSLTSPTDPPTRAYTAPKSPQSPRVTARSPSEPKSPRYTPKSPVTPTSNNHFHFPPSPTLTAKRKFSFSGPKSPKSPQSRMARSPSSESTHDVGEECLTMATSLSRPSSPRGLAYLASRRGSRESNMSNMSNVSNEELAPLNFSNTARGRQRRTSNFLELPVPDHVRPRVCSLPDKPYNPRSGDELYRLRTFSITNKGVVNYGDSIINRRSRSNTSVNSTASRHSNHSNVSNNSPWEGSCCGSSYNNVSTETSGEEVAKYRVVLLGDSGVGKTALVSQFMTSEYMNTYDASLDDEFGEKTVSVLLDGEESEMVFIDHPNVEMSVENSLSTYEPHACIVVYSIVQRASFKTAEDILNYLWRESFTKDKSVIVVGNKADLARARVITPNEGKALAGSRDCKFIETSSGIQHNVDELLVGVLKQIRLRETREKKRAKRGLHGSKTSLSLNIAREILHKMCLTDAKSKSCENLHVL